MRSQSRLTEIPAEERELRNRMKRLLVRMRNRTMVLVLTGWGEYVRAARQAMRETFRRWQRAGLFAAFESWVESAEQRRDNAEYSAALRLASDRLLKRSQLLSGLLLWTECYYDAMSRAEKRDRAAVEVCVAVAELQLVYGGVQLASHGQPNSCADCDGGCERRGIFRYYHLPQPPPQTSIDLCEMCFAHSLLAESMSEGLRAQFSLVGPQVAVDQAWRDIAQRESELARLSKTMKGLVGAAQSYQTVRHLQERVVSE